VKIEYTLAGLGSRCLAIPAAQFGHFLRKNSSLFITLNATSSPKTYSLSDFDYTLPPELIAQFPPAERGASRLLDVDGTLYDRRFAELPALLHAGDVLVFNDTKVIPARVFAQKDTGGKVEMLIERVLDSHHALAHIRASKAPKAGSTLAVDTQTAPQVVLKVEEKTGSLYRLQFPSEKTVIEWLHQFGELPLPPYITHTPDAEDAKRYQTVYAKHEGAVAAPTAGLHFTDSLLAQLDAMGVQRAHVTLHVGAGTFQPVRTEDLSQHVMHSEWYEIAPDDCARINRAKHEGRRVIAVGTTSLRALESGAIATGVLQAGARETQMFITPGYTFKIVDALISNFHLPKSTLMMLVSALAGYDEIRAAYAHAVAQQYRFFSYGDAMFLRRR
jgi:S-adenosylmethionine:tRNA ribosyltransferase-isomerase